MELFVDEHMGKGDLDVEASLVEGEEKVVPTPAPHPERAELVVHEAGATRSVPVDKELITIGRLPDCDVVLDDKGASRRHAQIRSQDGTATLTDLGSTNGTQLNGERVGSRSLTDGDRITIGTTVIEFRSA